MPLFRLRTFKRRGGDDLGPALLDERFEAPDNPSAEHIARSFPVNRLFDDSDYALLTDEKNGIVWSLKLEDADLADWT